MNTSLQSSNWVGADEYLAGLKRVNIFCGGYGSGKTEVAVNFAVHLASAGERVRIADLDIVNPYFRTREVRVALRERGVDVLVPHGQLVYADLPVIQPEVRGALEHADGRVVFDLGGDPAGARVMASMIDALPVDDYTGLFVVNSRRPFTSTPEAAQRMMSGISRASGLELSALVVNSHLIDETEPGTIDEGIRLAEEVASRTGARIAFVAVERRMLGRFDAERCAYPVMALDRRMLKPWEDSDRIGPEKFKL